MTLHQPSHPGTTSPLTPTRPHATAEHARGHVNSLREQGGSYRSIAQAAGLAPTTVHDIAAGRARPRERTTIAVLTVTTTALRRPRVDAGGTRLRLRALHVMGHGSARIARAAGASDKTIRALVKGDAKTISVRLRDTITAIYDAWWDKRAPERTPYERAAATTARRMAIRGNWCAAAALDDDLLDVPGYKPAYGWRPARGTGTAPDFPQPAPQRRPRHPRPDRPT